MGILQWMESKVLDRQGRENYFKSLARGDKMKIGDLVKVTHKGNPTIGYIKKFGRYGRSYVMIVYLTGSHVGKERFFSEKEVLPINQLIGEERA